MTGVSLINLLIIFAGMILINIFLLKESFVDLSFTNTLKSLMTVDPGDYNSRETFDISSPASSINDASVSSNSTLPSTPLIPPLIPPPIPSIPASPDTPFPDTSSIYSPASSTSLTQDNQFDVYSPAPQLPSNMNYPAPNGSYQDSQSNEEFVKQFIGPSGSYEGSPAYNQLMEQPYAKLWKATLEADKFARTTVQPPQTVANDALVQTIRQNLKADINDAIQALKMEQLQKAPSADIKPSGGSITDVTAQGKDFRSIKDANVSGIDMNDYIRKDEIPCWGCSIPTDN